MFIQTIPTADDCSKIDFEGKTAVVIDVLRASTVIINALANGALEVFPASSTDEAFSLFEKLGSSAILGGERDAVIIDGFHFGNSPLQYTSEVVKNKQIILKTTNGTHAINACLEAESLLIAAFINLGAITQYLINHHKPLVLVCSGTNGRFSMDDALCAGMIAARITAEAGAECCDLTQMLITTAKQPGSIRDKLQGSFHLNYLLSIGYEQDLDFCLRTSVLNTIPRLCGNRLVVSCDDGQ
jgi:2-phosphosulfolactate phosphatase